MLASGIFGSGPVVGASGIVFGLAGGVLWLDYRRNSELPASWRFPRRHLLWLVAINGVLGAVLPVVAFAAHAGGFVVGALATALVTGRVSTRAPLWTRAASVLAVTVTGLAVWSAGIDVFAPGDPLARYVARFARLPGISPIELNDRAWIIATSEDPVPNREVLEAALVLAERAVSETGRSEPTILDTLAEVHFQLGNADAAIATIDEAIGQQPDDPYYREQRRRFTGERDASDRPTYLPPWMRLPQGEAQPPEPEPSDPGLTI
jgi:hypothetical protein